VFTFDGGIRFKNAVYDIRGKIIFKAIAAVRLRFDVSQKGTRNTCGDGLKKVRVISQCFRVTQTNFLALAHLLERMIFSMCGPELIAGQHFGDDQIFVELQQIGILHK